MNNKSNYKLPVLAAALAVVLIIILSVVNVFTDKSGSDSRTSPTPTSSASAVITPETASESFEAIITSVDTDNSLIMLCRLGSTEFEEYTYTGATDIRTGYGKVISATLLRAGNFVVASAGEGNRLLSLTGATDFDTYKGVHNLQVETDLKRISIGDTIYRYDDSLLVLNEGYFVGIDTLYKTDIVSVYSIDNFIYLIEVTTGHGYLKLANIGEFAGGYLNIGTGTTLSIEEDMLVILSEGEYTVSADKGDLSGEATIRISRDKTAVFDLSPYLPEPVEYGSISFTISPEGADLYIDGIYTDYSSPVNLSYGEHEIEVVLGGYTSYEGSVNVTRTEASVSISLSAAPQTVASDILYDESAYTDSSDDSSYSDIEDSTSDAGDAINSFSSEEAEADASGSDAVSAVDTEDDGEAGISDSSELTDDDVEGLQLIIHCTEGAAVFVDDVYKGVIENGELSIDKPSGTIALRFTCEGYITKYYTVTIDNDGQDAEFTFPDMVME